MMITRLLVMIIGVIAIVLACFVGQLGDVFAVAKKTVGAFSAPLLAVFVLGFFFRRASAVGVFLGTWLGAAFTLFTTYWLSHWFSMWIFPIGFFSTLVLSLILSAFFPSKKK